MYEDPVSYRWHDNFITLSGNLKLSYNITSHKINSAHSFVETIPELENQLFFFQVSWTEQRNRNDYQSFLLKRTCSKSQKWQQSLKSLFRFNSRQLRSFIKTLALTESPKSDQPKMRNMKLLCELLTSPKWGKPQCLLTH